MVHRDNRTGTNANGNVDTAQPGSEGPRPWIGLLIACGLSASKRSAACLRIRIVMEKWRHDYSMQYGHTLFASHRDQDAIGIIRDL